MRSAIVAIGDELLDGFTLDTNSHWLSERLRLLGVPLKRRTTVRDRLEDISEQVRRDLSDPDLDMVFTSGGLGPTPDDRTFEAIALALGHELVVEPLTMVKIEERIRALQEAGRANPEQVREGNLRMALIPDGALRVLSNSQGMAPGLAYRVAGTMLFVLPGVPRELKAIFTEEIEPQYLSGHIGAIVRELHFEFPIEARFYPVMRELERTHPDVSIGSYPNVETRALTIRALGSNEERVNDALSVVRARVAEMGIEPTP